MSVGIQSESRKNTGLCDATIERQHASREPHTSASAAGICLLVKAL